jgi:hypothetical protein
MTAREQVDFALANHRGLTPIQMVLVPEEIWGAFCDEIGQRPNEDEVTYRDLPVQEGAARTMVTLIVG